MNSVTVSIVTVAFNASSTIKETIDSVLNQKDELVEYIIVDGGSRDGTLDIIQSYGNQIDKVISEPDKGISDAFNKGIRKSSGDIICIVNSDDILYEGSIKAAQKFFSEDPELDILFGDVISFCNNMDDGFLVRADTDLTKIRYAFLLPHPGMFISRKAYEKYGDYSLDYKNAMDYDLVSRMYKGGARFKYANRILAAFREGGTSKNTLTRTIAEHIKIAKNNGAGVVELQKYIAWIRIRRSSAPLLKALGIENALHKIVKGY